MNARCFVLPAIIVAIFAVSYSPADELPVAPPPRLAKTNAELLVGTWRVIKRDGKEVPKDQIDEFTFTSDGKFSTHFNEPIQPEILRFGTYKLNENIIHIDIKAGDGLDARKVNVKILSLTENELLVDVRSAPRPEKTPNVLVLQRRNAK